MDGHLRYSGLGWKAQRDVLKALIAAEPTLMAVLSGMAELALPQGLLVAGAIYNHVWNVLTDRPPLAGVKDIDIVYFDGGDLSYAAEDVVIRAVAEKFSSLVVPVEVRNQARVHLWFPQKFNQALSPLTSSDAMLALYASITHAVAARLNEQGEVEILAPFGLDDIFSFRLRPNRALPGNEASHAAKAMRAKAQWPQLQVEPW